MPASAVPASMGTPPDPPAPPVPVVVVVAAALLVVAVLEAVVEVDPTVLPLVELLAPLVVAELVLLESALVVTALAPPEPSSWSRKWISRS
jgi:hypothetical protein